MNCKSVVLPRIILVAILLFFRAFTPYSSAEDFDWPRWRGPNGNGVSKETGWNPDALKGSPKIAWRTNIGTSYSNVVIEGSYLYTTGSEKQDNVVYCFHAETGKKIWKYSAPRTSGYYPQPTPAVDGDSVYAMGSGGELLCLDVKKGKIRWAKNVVEALHAKRPEYGFASSPVVDGDLLVLNVNEYGAALSKKTGEPVWISPSRNDAKIEQYATPVFFDFNNKRCAIIFGNFIIYAVEVETGKPIFSINWDPRAQYCIADPIVFDDKVFISTDYYVGCAQFDIKGQKPKTVWQNMNMNNHFSTSVLIDGYLFGIDGLAATQLSSNITRLRCLDWKTGKIFWEKETIPASLIAADGKLIILDEKGNLFIAKATPSSYQEIARYAIPVKSGYDKWWTPPVLCKGKIYCKSNSGELVCIDVGT
jgi:outer membrane protein assembly factor BamB